APPERTKATVAPLLGSSVKLIKLDYRCLVGWRNARCRLGVNTVRGPQEERAMATGSDRAAPRRVQKGARVVVEVEADIESGWAVVRDVTRVGEWSHECVGASWVGRSTAAIQGARFRGRNRAGVFRWGRVCEIGAAEPYRLVWRTVPSTFYPDSSEWSISLDETEGGTAIEQSFRV